MVSPCFGLPALLLHARPTGMCNGCKERWPCEAWPFLLVSAPGFGDGNIYIGFLRGSNKVNHPQHHIRYT